MVQQARSTQVKRWCNQALIALVLVQQVVFSVPAQARRVEPAAAPATPAVPQSAVTLSLVWASTEVVNYFQSVSWQDYDSDGDLDAFAKTANTLYRYTNDNGDLETEAVTMTVSGALTWSDYDDDGYPDFSVASSSAPYLRIYHNEAVAGNVLSRTFTLLTQWTPPNHVSRVPVWADYDADNDLDFATYYSGTVEVYRSFMLTSTLTRTFELAGSWLLTDTGALSIDATLQWVDYDADGYPDLSALALDPPHGVLLHNSPAGPARTFVRDESWELLPASYVGPSALAWGDVDLDGYPEAFVGDADYSAGRWYHNVAGGPFGRTLANAVTIIGNGLEMHFNLADVDRDGDLDLLRTRGTLSADFYAELYENTGSGFGTSAMWNVLLPHQINSTAWGDSNNDGTIDLLIHASNGPLRLYRVTRDLLGGSQNTTPSFPYLYALSVGDYNADGAGDLVVGGFHTTQLIRNVNGVLVPGQILTNATGLAAEWGDYDADGDLDLVVGLDADQVQLYINSAPSYTLSLSSWSPPSTPVKALAWADVDSDGDLDLLVGNETVPSQLYLTVPGAPTPTLQLDPRWTPAAASVNSLAWSDVDGDGDPDLAVGYGDAPPQLFLNQNGQLDSTPAWTAGDGEVGRFVAWGDYDQDGRPDLATAGFGRVRIFDNTGTTLSALPGWTALEHLDAISLDWGDYNQDGYPDLLVGTTREYQSMLYVNDYGDFNSLEFTPPGVSALIARWVDLDRDGDLDTISGFDCIGACAGPLQVRINSRASGIYATGAQRFGAIPTLNLLQADHAPASYSAPRVWDGTRVPFTYTLIGPSGSTVRQVQASYSVNDGPWLPATPTTDTLTTLLPADPLPVPASTHVFYWNAQADGLFGQFDNVRLRLDAVPIQRASVERIPHTPWYARNSGASSFVSVRGTQIRVLTNTLAAEGALVYHLPAGQLEGAQVLGTENGPFTTNAQGNLSGHGSIALGDRLIALLPISETTHYTLYNTSAAPTLSGVDPYTVTQTGLQTLTVSPNNPLILLNLDVSLEWDARNDEEFLGQLDDSFRRTAEILYDISNGQMTLGQVDIYQAKEHWLDADVVMYASNGIRPNANMGGIVLTRTNDIGITSVISDAYLPGQVRVGPNWNRFGNLTAGDFGEDWSRALAHELGHYALFQPDNYIGFDADGLMINPNCVGSVMTDAYSDAYSEFLTRVAWIGECLSTVAAHTTGRTDWESITAYYPFLRESPLNAGPGSLPLGVTEISFVEPSTPVQTLDDPIFDIYDENGAPLILPPSQADVVLVKTKNTAALTDDHVVSLGAPYGSLVRARGAEPGDKLCVYDYSVTPERTGCTVIGTTVGSVTLRAAGTWAPVVRSYPVSSTLPVLAITTTLSAIPTSTVYVQFLPAYGLTNTMPVTGAVGILQSSGGLTYTQVLTLPYPVYDGYLRVWQAGTARESFVQFSLGASWAANRGGFNANRGGFNANRGGFNANRGGFNAPVSSSDGTVFVFTPENIFADSGDYTLQVIPRLGNLPTWLTPVGSVYRFSASQALTRTLAFNYLQRDVPAGYEFALAIYYSPDDGVTWERLYTRVEPVDNLASARMPTTDNGTGLYALVSTIEMPPLVVGWNLLSYPVPEARAVDAALASIDGAYTSVYANAVGTNTWTLYDATVVRDHAAYAGLVNTLAELEYAHNYWLYATQVVTPYIGVPTTHPAIPQTPPATYYGPVQAAGAFSPTVGMIVTAWVGTHLCGTGTTTLVQGAVAYAVQVAADEGVNGCGVPGRAVAFKVGNQPMQTVLWDNTQAQYVVLVPQAGWVVLPVIVR